MVGVTTVNILQFSSHGQTRKLLALVAQSSHWRKATTTRFVDVGEFFRVIDEKNGARSDHFSRDQFCIYPSNMQFLCPIFDQQDLTLALLGV